MKKLSSMTLHALAAVGAFAAFWLFATAEGRTWHLVGGGAGVAWAAYCIYCIYGGGTTKNPNNSKAK